MRAVLTKTWSLPLGQWRGRRWQWRLQPGLLLLALLLLALFVRLGLWQCQRAQEKESLAARYQQRMAAPVLSWAGLLAQGPDVDDYRVSLSGHFDNHRVLYLDNQRYQGRPGFQVFTVFFPAGESTGVLVNRGWLAAGRDLQQLPALPLAHARHIQGSAARPSPYFTVGAPDYRQRPLRVARLEMGQLARAFGVELRPFVIRLQAPAGDGLRRDWSPAARLGMVPAKHRAYALQWFSLAALVLALLLLLSIRPQTQGPDGNGNTP